jgi:thiol:disulfide interchange protein DsbD
VIDHAAPVKAAWQGDRLTLRQALSPQRSESPATLELVLTAPGQRAGLALAAPLQGGWPAVAAATGGTEVAAAPVPAPAAEAAPAWGLVAALGMAFVGGLLLNLMPCVFPVLSLKVLGLAAHGTAGPAQGPVSPAGDGPGAARSAGARIPGGQRGALVAGGLAYTGGVLASFLGLAGLLLLLRAGGAELGWGFQLQSPGFVAFLAALFTLIGLNLSGVFNLAGVMPAGLCGMHARRPVLDQALTGVLAVLIASPCTAPFMGMALGVALTQPPLQALAVFAALGLGMAAPYLLLCSWPRLARHLPRPGAWMEQFKLLLAFPMYATVVWLLWVLGHQAGIDAVAGLLGLLVLLAFGAWVLGSRALGRRTRRGLGMASVLMLVGGGLLLAPALRTDAGGASTVSTATTTGQRWQPWSAEAVAQARAAGRPVLVDFTAAWCVTCQFNKLGTLANAGLLGELAARQVLLLRADWTLRDPAITQALAALGRSGVPVYALYGPGQAEPRLLPEVLSVASVREAIAPWPSRATAGTADIPGAVAASPARPVPVP